MTFNNELLWDLLLLAQDLPAIYFVRIGTGKNLETVDVGLEFHFKGFLLDGSSDPITIHWLLICN